jgi:molecular chaperone GrpE
MTQQPKDQNNAAKIMSDESQDRIADHLANLMGQASDEGSAEPEPNPEAEVLIKLVAENAEIKDKLLRTLAEMENLRRRTEREVGDARSYGISNFARDVLGFADNLRRAVEAIPADDRASEGALKAFVDGVELTERDFLKTLERHGVRQIDPKGLKFDPNLHQAMFEAQNPDVPNGTVMEVLQVGYAIGERVLRPALVGVARGGPKPGVSESIDKSV